jgi:hypothetical protein
MEGNPAASEVKIALPDESQSPFLGKAVAAGQTETTNGFFFNHKYFVIVPIPIPIQLILAMSPHLASLKRATKWQQAVASHQSLLCSFHTTWY